MICISTKVYDPAEIKGRKCIVMSARIHPGEPNSSWIMHGFIDFILGASPAAKFLRDNFVFKLVPMLNPDGVIVGNHRCNINGYDLNRQWKMGDSGKRYAPEVWLVKNMIRNTLKERQIAFYCDMHGHKYLVLISRKQGIFFYGCNNNGDPQKKYLETLFPLMLAQQSPKTFSLNRCHFRIAKKKEGTGRVDNKLIRWLCVRNLMLSILTH